MLCHVEFWNLFTVKKNPPVNISFRNKNADERLPLMGGCSYVWTKVIGFENPKSLNLKTYWSNFHWYILVHNAIVFMSWYWHLTILTLFGGILKEINNFFIERTIVNKKFKLSIQWWRRKQTAVGRLTLIGGTL